MPNQTNFFFEMKPSHKEEDFIVWQSNQDAVNVLENYEALAGKGVIIYGEKACGKSHLMKFFADKTKAVFGHMKKLPNNFEAPVIIEDVDLYLKAAYAKSGDLFDTDTTNIDEGEKNLFHFFNQMVEQNGVMVLTARTPPSKWDVHLPDLRSRLMTVPAIRIDPADEQLLKMLVIKLFADRQININPLLINYMMIHAEQSYQFMVNLVDELDRRALEANQSINKEMVKAALEQLIG